MNERITLKELVLGIAALVAPVLSFIFIGLCLSGCVYRGAKLTEGTDLAIGLSVPGTDGAVDLSILNYLSGFRLAIDKNAVLHCKYTTAETNDYLGVVHTKVFKAIEANVEPIMSTNQVTGSCLESMNN